MNFDNCFQFFDNSRTPVIWVDRRGRIVYANPSAGGELGYDKEELLQLSLTDIEVNLTPGKWEDFFGDITSGINREYQSVYQRRDCSQFPVLISYSHAGEGEDVYLCAFIRGDPTDRKSERHREQLQFAVDNSLDAFFLSDREGRIIHVNESACKSLGYSHTELTSMRTDEIDPSEIITDERAHLINGLELDNSGGIFESRHRRKDGSIFPVEVTYNNITYEGEQYSFAFARDISRRKELEREREELRFLVDNASDEVYVYDHDAIIRYVNRSATIQTGYSREDLLGMSVMELNPDITAEIWEEGWRKAKSGRDMVFETGHQRKDGSVYPVEISVIITGFDGVEYACAFVRNITARKRVTREAEELRFVVENSIDNVYVYGRDGRFRYVNKSACMALGYSREEMLKMTLFDIDPTHNQETLDKYWEQRRRGGMTHLESSHKTRDGKLTPVEISVNMTEIDGVEYSCAFVRDISERKEALRQLEVLQFAIDNAMVPFYFYDNRANLTYANKSACRVLGYTPEELTKMTVHDIDPGVTPEVWKDLYPNVKAGNVGTVGSTNRKKDGTVFPVEVSPTNMTFGDLEFGCSVNLDISERVEAEKALRESEEKFRLIADTTPVALIIHRDSDGSILYANRSAASLFNRDIEKISGQQVTSLFDSDETRDQFTEILSGKEQIYGHELMLGNQHGKTLWVSLNARTLTLQGEKVVCSALLDITEAHNLSLQLSYQATYDSLTGLVNRREFESRLKRVMRTAGKNQSENAMCYLDLDQFKVINDTCGHVAGDELLRQLSQALQSHIRKRDTLARLGGDEFAILLENCNLQQAGRVANTVREAIQDLRFAWKEKSFRIGVSIGLVPIDWRDVEIGDVMRRADTACYQAKENGRNRIHVYDKGDEELARRQGEMQWVSRITSALEHDRLQLWSQRIIPIKYQKTGKDHYELLLRMVDEDGGVVPPGAFLPAAERYNLIERIDRWVINAVLYWFTFHPEKFKNLKLCSINLSGQSLSNEDFLREIIENFDRYELSPKKFCFELTETAAITNLKSATQFIKSLKDLGCRFALDDFGSGLSSFAYLNNLPVDFIKIDGHFIRDLHTNPVHLSLVKSINEVGHVMGKKTIAEFVENRKILKKLRKLGVDYAQGYGIAKPELMIEGVVDGLQLNSG